jgi:hypothetical protein
MSRAGTESHGISGLSWVVWHDRKAIYQALVSYQSDSAPVSLPGNIAAVLLFVSALKLIAEIALMALLGQWVLGLMAGAKRDTNFFYRLLQVMTQPFIRLARLISPRVVLDRHVPLVAFLLLAFGWLIATITKINICVQIGVEACK